ncbi:MAG: hypothetical protein AAGF11_26300 [Myxococcota bacterium]
MRATDDTDNERVFAVQVATGAEFHEHAYPGVVDDYEADPDAALRAVSATFWPQNLLPRQACCSSTVRTTAASQWSNPSRWRGT